MIDIVTIFHNEVNEEESKLLHSELSSIETDWNWFPVDNTEDNRGFAKGSNYGASQGNAEIIGFLNPDCRVFGPFIGEVRQALSLKRTVIVGSRHEKPQQEVRAWGLNDWVCGCTMFVERSWFESVGGFDESYVWSWEDTDLCRQAESSGLSVRSIKLPISHSSPSTNSRVDRKYKRENFDKAAAVYRQKWGVRHLSGVVRWL